MTPDNGRIIVVNGRHQVVGKEYTPDGRVKVADSKGAASRYVLSGAGFMTRTQYNRRNARRARRRAA